MTPNLGVTGSIPVSPTQVILIEAPESLAYGHLPERGKIYCPQSAHALETPVTHSTAKHVETSVRSRHACVDGGDAASCVRAVLTPCPAGHATADRHSARPAGRCGAHPHAGAPLAHHRLKWDPTGDLRSIERAAESGIKLSSAGTSAWSRAQGPGVPACSTMRPSGRF